MKISIFDLDGCISDDRHRRHLLPKNAGAVGEDYRPYTELCGQDAPKNQATWVSARLDSELVVITARCESERHRTRRWLDEHFGGPFTLFMRPMGDDAPSPELKQRLLVQLCAYDDRSRVVRAYDDRVDVLKAYRAVGVAPEALFLMDLDSGPRPLPSGRVPVDQILSEMALTFRERNAVYKDNYKQVARLVKVLWPEGVPTGLVEKDQWHLFELMLVKISRFAISHLSHRDSIHDTAVYSAMIESILTEDE